jgi:hypothetical protein
MKEEVFVRLDGDQIGDSIELALMNNNTKEAQSIHNSVQVGMQEMVKLIESVSGTTILLAGSDDILFSIVVENDDLTILDALRNVFVKNTTFTVSIGVGYSISSALVNLTKAKLSGRNRIVSDF